MPEKNYIPKQELVRYYSEENLYLSQIGKIYNCTGAYVNSQVKKYGLVRNYQDSKWLYNKHYVERKKIFEMAAESNSSEDSIRRWMKHHDIKTDHKLRYERMGRYSFKENYFEFIDTEEKAYWLGFIVADGAILHEKQTLTSKEGKNYYSNRLQILLSRKDREHLEKFKKSIEYTGVIEDGEFFVKGKKYYNSCIRINSKKICNDLKRLNVLPNKSLKEQTPDFLREDLKKHFIRGHFDGDGCFGYSKVQLKSKVSYQPHFTIIGGKKIISKILSYIKNNVVPTKANVLPTRIGGLYSARIGGTKITPKLMDWLYKDATIYLDRKKKKYEEWQSLQ